MGGYLARNARFDAPTYLVLGPWFAGGLVVSWGKVAKRVRLA